MRRKTAARPTDARRPLPRAVWILGCVSMLMDVSSEMAHGLLPIFMSTVLGASIASIGVIDGVVEATAAITKMFSGALSDYFRKRKLLVVLGYALSAGTKPALPLATTIWWVFGARFVDRVGKGVRDAPRDALIADVTPPDARGAAYGLRQSLDTAGAVVGPLLAMALMLRLANDIAAVLWVAVVPAVAAVLLLVVAVREPETTGDVAEHARRLSFADAGRLGRRFWHVVALGAVLTLARFSESFLVLRAQDVGLAIGFAPAIMIAMNVVYAACAYPAGAAADERSVRTLLLVGVGALVVADVVLATAVSPWSAFVGAAFWGLHMALSQGLLAKLVADNAIPDMRGTAFGVFNLVSGLALLLASVIAGALWNEFGAASAFVASGSFAVVGAAGLLFYRPAVDGDRDRRPAG